MGILHIIGKVLIWGRLYGSIMVGHRGLLTYHYVLKHNPFVKCRRYGHRWKGLAKYFQKICLEQSILAVLTQHNTIFSTWVSNERSLDEDEREKYFRSILAVLTRYNTISSIWVSNERSPDEDEREKKYFSSTRSILVELTRHKIQLFHWYMGFHNRLNTLGSKLEPKTAQF